MSLLIGNSNPTVAIGLMKPFEEPASIVEAMERGQMTTDERDKATNERVHRRCGDERAALPDLLRTHIHEHPVHSEVLGDLLDQSRRAGDDREEGLEKIYLGRLIDNETRGFSPDTEAAMLARAVPGYSLTSGKMDLTTQKAGGGGFVEKFVDALVAAFTYISESLSVYGQAPALYYRFALYAPAIYSFLVMFLLALFPLVMLWSFWPERWTALVHYFRLLLSVKLLPVLWSWTSAINEARFQLNPADPDGSLGTGNVAEWFPALVSMYFLAPAISYLFVAGITRGATNLAGQILGPLGGTAGAAGERTVQNVAIGGAKAGVKVGAAMV